MAEDVGQLVARFVSALLLDDTSSAVETPRN
jgi:hypothetical protein